MDEKSVGGLQLDIGNMYLLYLSRGTLNDEINTKVGKGKGSEICQQASGPNSVRQFFLFDYYDKLVCSRETEHLKLTETDFLGLRKIPAESSYRAISEQYLTLVDLEKAIEADNKNPFFYGDGKKPSDKPFLSMIQISLLPEIKQWKEKDLEASITEGYVAKFLAECSEGIESIVSEYQESGLISKIFCSISACNLCVAIRSRQIDEVHEIAMENRQMRLDSESSDFYQFPSMRCSTFTTMGIEEQASRDTSGYNLECVTDSLSKVVLRLALDDQGILNKDWKKTDLRGNSLSSSGNTGESGGATAHMEEVMGLYGRYDLSVQMGIGDFMKIFPILYNYKFIRKNMNVNLTKYTNDPVLLYVCNILRQKEAYVLNERILVSLKAGGAIENTNFDSRTVDKDLDLGLRETIQDQNCRIDYSLKALLDANALDDIFPRYLYRRHILILTDIWNEFKNLRFQADSFVNGYILYSHFDYLCRIIKGQLSALNDIAKKNDEELLDVAFKDFVENFRTLLRRIHDYYKLLQAVNYQSTQAPLLEMQMRTDLEKYVLAYTEFSQMLLKAIRDACNVDSASLQTINHIFTIDTMQSMIKAAPLFLLPYDSEGEKIYKARSDEKILLSVVVPGIDSKAKGNQLVTTFPETKIEWLELMQHHFTSTRLMDWSESAISALMFALEAFINPTSDRELEYKRATMTPVIWVMNPKAVNYCIYDQFSSSTYGENLIYNAVSDICPYEMPKAKKIVFAQKLAERMRKQKENFLSGRGPGKDFKINGIVCLSVIVEERDTNQARMFQLLNSGEFNPFFYLLSRYYADGLKVKAGVLPPLSTVHPYHSPRIQAQHGVFTVVPHYYFDENQAQLFHIGIDKRAMEHQALISGCLYEVRITHPAQLARDLLLAGERRSAIYPELQVYAGDIEAKKYYV